MLLGASLPVQAQEGISPERQGLLLDLGSAFGFADRHAIDAMVGVAWKGPLLRVGVQAGAGVVLQKGDDTTNISGPVYGGGYYAVQEDVTIDVFHRFYLLPRIDLCVPLSSLADLTVGGGVGPAWIASVSDRLVGSSASEDNPGLLVRVNLGLDLQRTGTGIRFEMGFENQSYRLFRGKESFDISDPKFLVSVSFERLFFAGTARPRENAPTAPSPSPWFRNTAAGKDSVAGSRSPASILKVIRANVEDFRGIYEKHLKENPGIGGKISLKFTIDPAGNIIALSIVSSNTGDPALDKEIKDRARLMKFEPIEKGNVTVTYAFVLENQ